MLWPSLPNQPLADEPLLSTTHLTGSSGSHTWLANRAAVSRVGAKKSNDPRFVSFANKLRPAENVGVGLTVSMKWGPAQ
jgi:hypothetical protein